MCVWKMSLQSLFHYQRKQMSTEPSSNGTHLLWLVLSGCWNNWWCLIVPEKDNEAFRSEAGVGQRAAIMEPKEKGGWKFTVMHTDSGLISNHVEPGPLVKWETLGDEMGKRNPWGRHSFADRNTTNESLTQSTRFSIMHTCSHRYLEYIRHFKWTAVAFPPCGHFPVTIYLITYFAFLSSMSTHSCSSERNLPWAASLDPVLVRHFPFIASWYC